MLLTISVFLLTVVWPGLCQAQSVPQRIEITAKRFNFVPGDITLKKGQAVVLILKSSDVEHGLRIREFGVNAIVKPGQTVEIKFTPDKVGDFVGHCSAFCGAGHGSMEIKLHVVA
jgi:Heme/copper-type cytochrome/quinol oxidases, subunit 2